MKKIVLSLILIFCLAFSAHAATSAAQLQLNMIEAIGTNAVFDVFYGVVDSTAQTSSFGEVRLEVPTDSPGTWTDSFIAAVVSDAATMGYTLTTANVRWTYFEPGDYKYPKLMASWSKDVTKTNLPSSLTNIYLGIGGEQQIVDFGGYKQYRWVVYWSKIGTGTQEVRLVDAGNAANYLT